MTEDKINLLRQAEKRLDHSTPRLNPEDLRAFVASYVDRREAFLGVSGTNGSPLYVVEPSVLTRKAARFSMAFKRVLDNVRVYYALKSNNNPVVVRTFVSAGLGLDVSSGEELNLALECGADRIVFSGPGKTDSELKLAMTHRDKVTLLLDSFGELERLSRAVPHRGTDEIRAGVRITTDARGLWRKFGIPIENLGPFFERADRVGGVRLCGLQFHLSWNLDWNNHVAFIDRLASAIESLEPRYRARIEFVDIGGGYWPEEGEWLQTAGTAEGRLQLAVDPDSPLVPGQYCLQSSTIEAFAEHIGRTVRQRLRPIVNCALYTEPGRWLCHDGMHLLLRVMDRKASDLVITDGGTNAIGWERFETDYFPVINLSRPALTERPCLVLGSLCTPHDVWGYGYWGADIKPGDALLIPTQGAYTYSLRQQFIKALPKTVVLG